MTSTNDQRPRHGRATSTSGRPTRAATRRPSASRRSSRAASATAPSSSSTASSRRTARKSSIEVVNLLLGQGNDTLHGRRHARSGHRRQADRHDRDHARVTGAGGVPDRDAQAHAAAAVRLEVAGLPRRPAGPHHGLRARHLDGRSASPTTTRRTRSTTPSCTSAGRSLTSQAALDAVAVRRQRLEDGRQRDHGRRRHGRHSSRARPATGSTDGFIVGQTITINGVTGSWR